MATNLKADVLRLARALGFAHCAVAPAEKPPHADFLDQWLASGWHGGMDWLARTPQWRKDIRTRYAWARSFLCISLEYPDRLPPDLPPGSVLPRVARYARMADYHEQWRPALARLEEQIIELGGPGTRALWYQDTGPFLERALAARAGLGWVGKNTMLIHPARGSFTLLALVLTSLELEPDAPLTDHCGTCTRCLEACPTGAFVEPWRLDASRCVSYLTIEHRGPVPHELRPGIGGLLFGCDICNEVCPWNAKTARPPVQPPPQLADLTLAAILNARPAHLSKRLQGTALERTGEAGLKRNAAIVAGNERLAEALGALEQSSRHDDPAVREAVYWAYARIGGPAAKAALARAQRHETDETLRDWIIETLRDWPAA
ncbi:MAG: tRNA epoxyqueuosine(34) reductase QueG [Planctomycetes bacterium]|nr:tRNA epoxyqueuosine(34) reductase QueG [Planctomycetota bacterium]